MRLMHDERENESFLYTRSNIFNSRKLNFVHYIFMCSFATACNSFSRHYILCPSYNKCSVRCFYFIFHPQSFSRCSVAFFPFSSSSSFCRYPSFHAKNSVFIMLLLLEPDAWGWSQARDLYTTCWVALLDDEKKSFFCAFTTTKNIKFMSLFDGSRLVDVVQCSEIIW